MGEPPKEHVKAVHKLMLKDKQEKAAQEKKLAEQKRLFQERQKKGYQQAKKKDEEKAEEEKKGVPMEEDVKVELTAEEKKGKYRPSETPDLNPKALAACYTKFSLPTKGEGFDEVKYTWDPASKCDEYLKAWILAKKKTQKVEDLTPGEWFKEEKAKWEKLVQEWRKKQNEWKDPVKRKAAAAKKAAEKKKEGEDGEEAKQEEPMEVNAEDVDVTGVKDVTDLGSGEPLFSKFAYEDWTLLPLRYELHLLCHAFKKDVNDPDRPKLPEDHTGFYYNRYFKKQLSVKNYGVDDVPALIELMKMRCA